MAIESMYVFTGDEVVATDLPAKLNENFAKTETNMLKTVNNVAQDENHNINVTELIPKQITSNTNLNNLVTSGEYTFTKGSATITNSPTPNSFFLTVLRNNALVKQVVTEVVLDDPITYTRVLSGSSWSPWVEGGKVKTINSIEPDDSGNVDLSSMDYAVRSEIGIWKPSEEVSVGDVRYLNGRENAGIVLECIEAGTTGTEQPTISDNTDNIIANFTSNDRIGHMRLIFNLAEKDADEIIALGIAYNRTTYPELWEYVQARPDLLLTETEWQAKYAETNGKFVPYYSSGNGTSTFRTPLLSAYIKGADSTNSLGSYLSAGLPNITGGTNSSEYNGLQDTEFPNGNAFGAFANSTRWSATGGTKTLGLTTIEGNTGLSPRFDASLSNPIYGNSTTVQPETMQGIWVIKAIGIIIDNNNTDISNVLNGITELETRVTPIGTIFAFAGNDIPSGYLPCNGGAISRTTYADLWAVIGTTYGSGDGSTTFNLPNLNNNSFLEGSSTAGTVKSAGLPNASGSVGVEYGRTSNNNSVIAAAVCSGAFRAMTEHPWGRFWATSIINSNVLNTPLQDHAEAFMDLSKSNSIYGNSTTVQPKSVTVKFCIKY